MHERRRARRAGMRMTVVRALWAVGALVAIASCGHSTLPAAPAADRSEPSTATSTPVVAPPVSTKALAAGTTATSAPSSAIPSTGSASAPTTVTTVPSTPPAVGTVRGRVVTGGGDPRTGGVPGATEVGVPGDTVRAVDGAGATRATAVSAQDGSFALVVGPGAFTVVEDVCGVRAALDVHAGENGPVLLVLPAGC